ncbi:nucleoside/nucleotide kinase family protein [Butyrivibrio sp. LC3010]|uniref:nucleoside/nucleotide kinase family protein n=1 Tax=Butyrivibrio sp. LC3010 TaxID=1280680 RepID=UPI0003FF7264|nr:nucleoside/nucleotide kinase family protein [Butyrivibrio sp. LC3010]
MEYFVNINGIDVNAHYSENAIDNIFHPLLERLSDLQREKNRRILVFLAAPPGVGKSTLASFLQKLSEDDEKLTDIQAIGMDGFHRRQEYLLSHSVERDGKLVKMVEIKGAPVTFDLDLLKQNLEKILQESTVGWPCYDRHLHNPVDNAITINKDIVLIEGNYLLLNEDGWRELKDLADYTIFISADENMLRSRLIDRKIKSGNTKDKAEHFVDYSDMANVRLSLNKSLLADLMLGVNENGDFVLPEQRK